MDKLGVHILYVREDEELFQRGVVAPLAGGLAEEGDVEQIGLVCVGDGGLFGGNLDGDQVSLDSIGVDTVVDLGKGAVEIPGKGETAVFVFLKALEFFDEVDFELGANPHPELKGDVVMSVGATIASRSGAETNGIGLLHPFLDAELVTVQSSLTFNYGEFAGIKIRVVDDLSNTEELDGVPIS